MAATFELVLFENISSTGVVEPCVKINSAKGVPRRRKIHTMAGWQAVIPLLTGARL
jgi:hypothetical protein